MARSIEAAALCLGGDVEEAMQIWQTLEEAEPDSVFRLMHRMNVAICLVRLGRCVESIAPVEHCLAEFLDLADALLMSGQPKEVATICREAIAYLSKAGLTEQALPGLALLREAAAMGKASLIQETRERVRRVARERGLVVSAWDGGG